MLDEEEFGIASDIPVMKANTTVESSDGTITTGEQTGANLKTTDSSAEVTKEATAGSSSKDIVEEKTTQQSEDNVQKVLNGETEAQKRAARAAKFGIPLKEVKSSGEKQSEESTAASAALAEKKRLRAERFGIPLKETSTSNQPKGKKGKNNGKKSKTNQATTVDPELVNINCMPFTKVYSSSL